MKRNKTGFTLIELLVVIAIIGILSAVVLASLNTARSKGNDSAIKANLKTVGTQAVLFASDNGDSFGTYDNGSGSPAACPAAGDVGTSVFHNSTVENAIAGALANAGPTATAMCMSDGTNYAVSVSRPVNVQANTSNYWCIDNSSKACGINNDITGATCGACDTTS